MAYYWQDIAQSLHNFTPFMVTSSLGPPKLSGTRVFEAILIAVIAGAASAFATLYVTSAILTVKIEHLKAEADAMRTEIREINQRTIELMLNKCPVNGRPNL